MVDIYIDDFSIKSIDTIQEGFKLNFELKSKDEFLHLVLNKEELINLYHRIKNRCETMGIVPIRSEQE